MPRIEPTPTPLSQPFWDATRDRRLLAQRCAMCDRYVWYPREHCPGCLRSELEWVELSGNGTIYTFNVMRKPGNPMMADAVPYVLALVDLDEGVRPRQPGGGAVWPTRFGRLEHPTRRRSMSAHLRTYCSMTADAHLADATVGREAGPGK